MALVTLRLFINILGYHLLSINGSVIPPTNVVTSATVVIIITRLSYIRRHATMVYRVGMTPAGVVVNILTHDVTSIPRMAVMKIRITFIINMARYHIT